jgi:hypothetical protein
MNVVLYIFCLIQYNGVSKTREMFVKVAYDLRSPLPWKAFIWKHQGAWGDPVSDR